MQSLWLENQSLSLRDLPELHTPGEALIRIRLSGICGTDLELLRGYYPFTDALIKVANAISMCQPDSVFIDTGSAEDIQWIREHSLAKGEEKKLAKEGHTIHFDLPQDQARLVNQTY